MILKDNIQKGRRRDKIVTVASLSEYLKVIEENNLYDCISRGENQKFESIRSSVVRPYDKTKSPIDIKMHKPSAIQSYYDCIAGRITPMQEKHFLAFSQHHGLPTNLIDFSHSPLVSLYFACDDAFVAKGWGGKYGYVHFIRNNRLVNVSSLISDKFQRNLLQPFFTFGAEYKLFEEKVEINPLLLGVSYYDTLVDNFKRYFSESSKCNKHREIIDFAFQGLNIDSFYHLKKEKRLKTVDRNYVNEQYAYIVGQILRVMSNEFYSGSLVDCFDKVDLITIKEHISKHNEYPKTTEALFMLLKYFSNSGITDFYLPVYLTYTPPEIFDRISSQRSIFIYQLYTDNSWNNDTMRHEYPDLVKYNIVTNKKELMPDYTFLFEQEIRPDHIIRIDSKAEILASLDKLGVNLKTIFGDYDSVAKYFKQHSIV